MTKTIHNPMTALFNEFDLEDSETIVIEAIHIDQAIELSDTIQNEQQQWQAYLNALSLFGFEEWLLELIPEIRVEREECTIYQPPLAGLIKAVCNLRVGEFKLCLLPMGANMDEAIAITKAAINLPEYTAHFYVVLSIIEELEVAKVFGFIRFEQLIERLQESDLRGLPNWTYRIPLTWFDRNLENLLLSLRCLQAVPLTSPVSSNPTPEMFSSVRRKLEQNQHQLQSEELQLWEIFTWQEAEVLFTHTQLFEGLYRTSNVLNVAQWLQDRLDSLAEELSWVLLPSFTTDRFRFAAAMRSPIEELDDIITQLERGGADIPQTARGAYQNLQLGETILRLYAVTWSLLSPENTPEWKLLLVLGAPDGNSLPHGTTLQISDNERVLVERVRRNIDAPYLYARVAGTWEETFSVTITLMNGETMTLPPFAFCP